MALLRFNPFLSTKDLIGPLDTPSFSVLPSSFVDEDNVMSTDKEFQISIDIPGVKASDISLTVQEDGTIRIEGVRRRVSNNGETTKKQRFAKSFKANPHACDMGAIKANLADGVLVITTPKRAKAAPLNVSITTEPHSEPEPLKEKLESADKNKKNQNITVQTVDLQKKASD